MRLPKISTGYILVIIALLFIALIAFNDNLGFVLIQVVLGLAGGTLIYSIGSQIHSAHTLPHRYKSKDFSLKLTATVMGLFLVVGTVLYFYVFWRISHSDSVYYDTISNQNERLHVQFNNVEYFLRSLICSLDLFMLDVDSNILDRLDDKPWIKVWISIQAVLSFTCTVIMLISLVYSRLNAYYKLTYRTRIDNDHNHLYLFFGINEPSEKLIKQIRREDANAVIVIIDEAKMGEDDSDEWEGIVGLMTHKHRTFDIADKYGVKVAIAGKSLSEIDDEITSEPDFNAFSYLGIPRIEKLIRKLKDVSDPQLHIFFLDDDEERNIRDIIALAKDKTILSLAKDKPEKKDKPENKEGHADRKRAVYHRIYCHARYNGPNRVIKDVAIKKKLDIKIIDSSHMAVERLKLKPEYHPVNVADIDRDNPCTVRGPFKALIVGFGEVGRDAFRFLYEFGAFIDNSATSDDAVRSGFECTIVDKDIDRIKGTLKSSMPGIFRPGEAEEAIRFENMDYNHEDFYTKVLAEDRITTLNYVIISIGDSDEAISLATRIFTRYRQHGGDLSKLMILVRCTDDAKAEAVQKIADHYNYGYGEGTGNTPVIHVFGQPEETYTYDLVISNHLVELGKDFHENYRLIRGETETWDQRHKKYTDTPVPEIDTLRKMRRQESQDIANALHVDTKMRFFRESMPDGMDWTEFKARYFNAAGTPDRTGRKGEITYPGLSDYENLVIRRLAMLEHIRWSAAHELLGYVTRTDGVASCDERTMKHNCLKPWRDLDRESELTEDDDYPRDYKEYDFSVIDTTLAMYQDKTSTTSPVSFSREDIKMGPDRPENHTVKNG